MTTSSTVSMRQPSESPPTRTAFEQRLDAQRRRSVPKITGRKLRLPRKFVITDVPDSLQQSTNDEDESNNYSIENNSEDLAASASSVRKGKTQIKGRFTITDLSPELPESSPEREDFSVSLGPTSSCDVLRRQSSRRLPTRRPFQSAGDVRSAISLADSKPGPIQENLVQETPLLVSLQRYQVSPPSSRRSESSGNLMSNQITHNVSNPKQALSDHHLEYLEKETHEMKSVLENMVATNSQWIEALSSAGIISATSASKSTFGSNFTETSPLEKQLRDVEKAYTELQAKYATVCIKSERLEVKNAMLEIRLQQQTNRSTMLRSQLDKLTQYTENLIGESSEPTLHDYNSDLNSILNENLVEISSTDDKLTRGGAIGFGYDVVKSRRQSWRDADEECISDASTEGDSTRKTLSPPLSDEDNNCCQCDIEFRSTDFTSDDNRQSASAFDSLLDDQCDQESPILNDKADDSPESYSVDSLAVCPSTKDGVRKHSSCNQTEHSSRLSNGQKSQLLQHSNSVSSINYSTVSSNSSLAGFGLHLATMAQSKSCVFASVASTSLFGPHPEPYPNASNQRSFEHDDKTVYDVLSPENLRFHDCQSFIQAAEARIAQNSSARHEYSFLTSKKAASLPGTTEGSEQTRSTGNLFKRFSLRRR
ncbi:uncharacterized protein PHALS_06543 [Plasmopara halstedii]|uniref:Uncharacterized protein n=1 Tax=Plasmopara halstedii TaxID=4781 RepID=A0A0P1B3S4_PLAHL|nr:uncharacterized protein PHALS_06543 [Plasmopara halstedii]CEG48737.1 hypothetical protein PHALS_06543 [Plasmopara halstedii]|eukprot:XP_024585106.1 hypothetical protein PHALS_06543 [Plasmopara halstedii]